MTVTEVLTTGELQDNFQARYTFLNFIGLLFSTQTEPSERLG